MIVTVTPNPSIDATLELTQTLEPGAVHRAHSTTRVAGGKGINVAHALHLAGAETVALFPADAADPFTSLVREADLPYVGIAMGAQVRTNTTLTEPDGRTTKANGPGPVLTAEVQETLLREISAHCASAEWLVLAGSLPGGVADDWYAAAIESARAANPALRIALDTSDKPMRALGQHLPHAAPNLIKPNGMELGQLVGVDGLELERQAATGDFDGVVKAGRQVIARGIDQVLVTLGGSGAVLVTAEEAWLATPPPVQVHSTVGAGDCSLAGFLLGRTRGEDLAASLRRAVAYGTAAAGLPGTTIPGPELINLDDTRVAAL